MRISLLLAAAATVSGRVVFHGTPPAPKKPAAVVRDRRACGASQPDESLVLSSDGGIANAVVVMTDVHGPARDFAPAHLDQRACRFVPHVVALPVGGKIEIGSSDPILHNVHAWRGEETVFNLAFAQKGVPHAVTVTRPGRLELRCDAGHDWMHGWIVVVEPPIFAVTGSDGRFTLRDVPPGRHTLEVWHETLGSKSATAGGDETGSSTVEIAYP